MKFEMIFNCEQCSHFAPSSGICTMGFQPQHKRLEQLALYELTGKMAFCRFLEID